jgi:putative transposase
VLPNHYHLLVASHDIVGLLRGLGRLHGRTAYQWNGEDGHRGRQVWCKAAETAMKSDRHAHATMNYIHNNPVKHGLVTKWQDWPYSSARAWLERVGQEVAERFWTDYPVGEYGKTWDI